MPLGAPLLTLTVPTDSPPTARISINHLVRQAGVSQAMRRRLRTEGRVYIMVFCKPGTHYCNLRIL